MTLARHGIRVPPKPVLSPTERVAFEAEGLATMIKYNPSTWHESMWLGRLLNALARLPRGKK
jgi:hypothetical protein